MFFGASKTFQEFRCLGLRASSLLRFAVAWQEDKAGVPVYIAAEGGAGIWKRIAAWHRLRHMDPAQMPMRVVTACLSLQTQAAELREAIEKTGVHLPTSSSRPLARPRRGKLVQRGRIPARHR